MAVAALLGTGREIVGQTIAVGRFWALEGANRAVAVLAAAALIE